MSVSPSIASATCSTLTSASATAAEYPPVGPGSERTQPAFTQAKEYAELEWPIDVAIAVVWLVFATNYFWTLKNRREKHLYVALWFYIATIVTVTILHVVNSRS